VQYVNNYFNSLFLRNKHKTLPSHNKFLKARLADPVVDGVDLDKLLEIPFQRLPKYTKLVKVWLTLRDNVSDAITDCIVAIVELDWR